MAYRPLWQSKVSDARGRGLVLAVNAEFARLWNYTLNEWTEVSVGSLIAGAADDLVVDIDSAVFSLIYANATMGWMLDH